MRSLLAVSAVLILATLASAQDGDKAVPGVGQRLDNVKLLALDGKHQTLHDFKGKKAVVVVFLTFDCPVSNSYLTELSELASLHKDAAFLGVITTDAELRRLNRRFRGKNYATDVLSFPPGEIAISLDRAKVQAADLGHSVDEELRILMLHGALHLRGMDHETDCGEMRRAETRPMILRDDFWTEIEELPASRCAAAARFDDELAIHAEFFRDLKCFNRCEQIDSAKQLIHELERLAAADWAGVDNFLSHRVQKRSNEFQILGAGTDHER